MLKIKQINLCFILNGLVVQLTAVLFITLHSFEDSHYVQTFLSENKLVLPAFSQRDTKTCSKISKIWNISVGHLGCLGNFFMVYNGADSWKNVCYDL